MSSSSLVFSRLLPAALLLAAKVKIQDFVENQLQAECFSIIINSSSSPSSSSSSSLLCSWWSLITMDEARIDSSKAKYNPLFFFEYVLFGFSSSSPLIKFINGSFDLKNLGYYLDFYITFFLVMSFILGDFASTNVLFSSSSSSSKISSRHICSIKSSSSSLSARNLLSSLFALAFWCLLGSHAFGRRTSLMMQSSSSDDNNYYYFEYSVPLMLCAVALAVQHLVTGHRPDDDDNDQENDNNNETNKKKKKKKKTLRERQVELGTAFLGNYVLPFIGCVIWTMFLLSGSIVENVPLWLSSSFFLLLSIVPSLAVRRTLASCVAVFAASVTIFILYFGVFSANNTTVTTNIANNNNNNNNNNNQESLGAVVWSILVHKLRAYGASMDVTTREANWFPGSIINELLVYGFRQPAAAVIVFQAMLPWMLTIVIAMKLKMKFEASFLICALCDHRDNTLCHFGIFLLLILSKKKKKNNNKFKNDDDDDSPPSVFSPLRMMMGVYSIFTSLVSIAYFGSWCLYRTAQQNMSFYALFASHLFGVVFLLFDHEEEEE